MEGDAVEKRRWLPFLVYLLFLLAALGWISLTNLRASRGESIYFWRIGESSGIYTVASDGSQPMTPFQAAN